MVDDSLEDAILRLDAAVTRAEAALIARPAAVAAPPAVDTDLAERHATLRATTADVLTRLDRLLATDDR